MAVGFDAATESGTWTTTPDPFTFSSHSVASGAGGLLFIVQAVGNSDDIDGTVTWGATNMSRILTMGSPGTEASRTYAYWAPSVPSGVSTISIPHTATSNTKIATAISVTGTGLTAVGRQASVAMNEAGLPSTRQHHIGTASAGMRFVCAYTGLGSPIMTPLSGMTAISDHDFGSNACQIARETSTSTDFTIGYTDSGDDTNQLALAVTEGDPETPTLYRYLHSSSATSHLAAYPPTASGDLLLASAAFSTNGGSITTPTDESWVRFDNDTGSSTMLSGLFYLECDGTASGSVDFVTNVSTNSTGGVHLWHIPAALRDTGETPECQITGPTSSGTPDPSGLTPSWGNAEVLWFQFLARDAADGITALSSNYDLHFQYDAFTGAERASSYRTTTATSEDPGSSTVGSTDEEFKAYVVGVLVQVEPEDVTGTGSSTLEGVASAGTGVETFTGSGASTLEGVTSAGTGVVANPVTGTGTSTLTGVTSAGAGSVIAPIIGAGTSTLDGVVSDGSGTVGFDGTGISTLDGVTSDGSGIVANPVTGTGSSTLDGVTSSGVGDVLLPGQITNVVCELISPTAECVLVGPSGACDEIGPACLTTMED